MLVLRVGTGGVRRDPKKAQVSWDIRMLRPGMSMVLNRIEEEPGEWYIQVWRRPEGSFQLEHRAGTSAEHYQVRAESVEKVVDAFFGWIERDAAWAEAFEWTNIGEWFTCPGIEGGATQVDPLSFEDSGS